MKSVFTKVLSLTLVCALFFSMAMLSACKKDGPCTGCEAGCEECSPFIPPEIDEISYYKMPNSFWLELPYPNDEICNFIKFKGTHNGNDYDMYYFDSMKHFVPTKTCIIKITGNDYGRYEWKADENDVFRWVRVGFNIEKKTAEKDVYSLFAILFSGISQHSVPETLTIDGKEISCNKFSQENKNGQSNFWRPEGYDFWIKCESFDISGNPFEISAKTVDLSLSVLPEFVILPF